MNSIDKLIKAKSRAVQRALVVNGLDMVDTIKINLNRISSRHKLYNGNHWSSKPGHTPNSDTGFLSNTVVLSPRRKAGSVEVIVFAKYARRLEFSRDPNIRRPFVTPVRNYKADLFRDRVLKAMKNA